MCSMIRRFVHLIVHELKSGPGGYSLRNIDMKPLFAGIGDGNTSMQVTPLPRAAALFESASKNHTEFFLLGSKIVSVNKNRHTILFDTLTSGALAGPHLRHGKLLQPAWAAIGGKLYLTSMFPENHGTPCFEALRYDNELEDWLWDLLPSPSFFDMPFGDGSIIHCFASGDDKNIWISTLGNGTHIFDTTTTTWHKVGDWALPFEGRVQYVPEYRQCFGFSERSSKLCSADLIFGSRNLEPPAYRNVWDDVDGYMGTQWHLARSYLTYLGCGKFCITRFYDTRNDWEDDYIPVCNVAVMTAVEVRCDSNTGHLEMIKGASRCYKFSPDTLYGWAL